MDSHINNVCCNQCAFEIEILKWYATGKFEISRNYSSILTEIKLRWECYCSPCILVVVRLVAAVDATAEDRPIHLRGVPECLPETALLVNYSWVKG